MLQRAQALKERAREAVPEGTFAVGAGLMVAAVTSYVFIVITLRTLGKEGSVGFSPSALICHGSRGCLPMSRRSPAWPTDGPGDRAGPW